ncbi:MAG: hypothetical protein ASARMPREDX12_001995 [Alectoria sarmentosa]|nr:MAG: hypothetical protein ASARMPREDX12_001995 [Alectoria sarmentosa]
MAVNSILDVLIIGGGPAGLSTATGLARQLYTAVVFDSGVYRNQLATHMHNVLTWDHQSPADFRSKGREDILKRYATIKFQDTEIKSVAKTQQGHFELKDAQGKTWTGRKLVLATGVRDVFPDIEGYGNCWARGIFHCLFCHGFEEKNVASAGVLAVGDLSSPFGSLHMARMAKRLTPNVTIYTDGAKELAQQTLLAAADDDIKVEGRAITLLEKGAKESSVVVYLEDGHKITEGFLVHKPKSEVNGPFAHQLALELTDQGDIKTNGMFFETSVPGVFAVGDCATPLKAVTQAVAMGSFGAGGLVSQLQIPVPKAQI